LGLSYAKDFETECPELWHFDESEQICRPERENVNLECSAEKIKIELDNKLLRTYSDILVNECQEGFLVNQNEDSTEIIINPEVCDAEIFFEESEVILRNTVSMYYGKHLLSIPFDCAFVAGGQHQDTVRQTSHSRKRRAAMAEATASFDITLDYFDQLFDEHLPPSRRLVVGEDAFVEVGLAQHIRGVEMGVTNCTVFDSNYAQSYSVIDYPRCPDDVVKAQLHPGSNQWANRLSYRVFEFVSDEMETSLLKLVCRVILCDANSAESECRKTCSSSGGDATSARLHQSSVQKT